MSDEPPRRYTLTEQREALEWLLNIAVPPLQILALRKEMPQEDLDRYLPAIEKLKAMVALIEQPWAQEGLRDVLKRGPPK